MRFKRVFDQKSLEEWKVRQKFFELETIEELRPAALSADELNHVVSTRVEAKMAPYFPEVRHVIVEVATPKWNVNRRFLDRGVREGWLEIRQNAVFIKSNEGPVVYKIVRHPGSYCHYCPHVTSGFKEMQDHVRKAHTKAANPGYFSQAYYSTEALEPEKRGLVSRLFGGK